MWPVAYCIGQQSIQSHKLSVITFAKMVGINPLGHLPKPKNGLSKFTDNFCKGHIE
jgi:hypothetical protein